MIVNFAVSSGREISIRPTLEAAGKAIDAL
jgi:hypothetical protein